MDVRSILNLIVERSRQLQWLVAILMIQTSYLWKAKNNQDVDSKLKESKKLIIEPSFFQEGTKQFTFDVEGSKSHRKTLISPQKRVSYLLEKSNYNWWGYNNYCGKGLLMLKIYSLTPFINPS